MLVASVTIKSSAVSVSGFPELGGWDSAPSRPSGEPVLKKKGSAQPGVARNSATVSVAATRLSRNIIVVLLDRRDAGCLAARNITARGVRRTARFRASEFLERLQGARSEPPKSCTTAQDRDSKLTPSQIRSEVAFQGAAEASVETDQHRHEQCFCAAKILSRPFCRTGAALRPFS